MPYYGYNGNISHGYGHISSNGYNNVVPPYHNAHGPVGSPSMAGPVGGMMGGTGSSTNNFAQHHHNPHVRAERPFTADVVRLPPVGDGSSASIPVQQHVPAKSHSMVSPAETPRRRNGSTLSPSAQPHQPQHSSGASYKSLPVRETVRSDRAPPAQLGGGGTSTQEEILRHFPLHGTRAPPTKRERRKLANKIKAEAEAEAATVAMALSEAEAARAAIALSEARCDHNTSSPVPEEEEKEDVEEKASNTGCGVASLPPDSQWLAVCRSVYQAAARRDTVVEQFEPGDVYVCEDPNCTVAICAKMGMSRVDSFELKDKADRVSPPPPHPIEAKRSVASNSSPPRRSRAATRRCNPKAIPSLSPVREESS